MSQSTYGVEKSLIADADLSAAQFYAIKATSTGCDLATANTDALIGVLQNTPTLGQAATVRISGTTKVKAGGSISVGDWVTATTGGKVIATTTDKQGVLGRALESASTNDIFEINIQLGTLSI